MSQKAKGFLNKIKQFFTKKEKWQPLAGLLIVVCFVGTSALVSSDVWAQFYRTSGTTGFSYGYGYGYADNYGYGYGYHQSEGLADYGFFGADGKATYSSVSVSSSSFTVTYSTDYLAKNKIEYGTTSSFGSSSGYTAYQTGTNTITVSGLAASTQYYYRIVSKDAGDNTWNDTATYHTATTSTAGGSTTSGYTPPAEPETTAPTTETGEVTVTASEGGITTLTNTDGSSVEVNIPANAVTGDTTISATSVDSSTAISAGSVGDIPSGLFMVGNAVYNISATDAAGNAVSDFSQAVSLTFTYTDDQIAGLDENALTVYYWDGTEWTAMTGTVDTANNTITVDTTHFTYFAIMGSETTEVELDKPIAEMTSEEVQSKIQEVIQALIKLISQLITELQAQLTELIAGTAYTDIPSGYSFDGNLSQGARSDDVKYLQIILKSEIGAPTYPDDVDATGYFGTITRAAVIKYQEDNASTILAPLGLTAGTGYVGPSTRTSLNALLGK